MCRRYYQIALQTFVDLTSSSANRHACFYHHDRQSPRRLLSQLTIPTCAPTFTSLDCGPSLDKSRFFLDYELYICIFILLVLIRGDLMDSFSGFVLCAKTMRGRITPRTGYECYSNSGLGKALFAQDSERESHVPHK